MPKSGVKITSNFNLSDLPMSIPCPNEECTGKLSFKISDVEAEKVIKCTKCGELTQLSETQQ